jgi:hypothetical protein
MEMSSAKRFDIQLENCYQKLPDPKYPVGTEYLTVKAPELFSARNGYSQPSDKYVATNVTVTSTFWNKVYEHWEYAVTDGNQKWKQIPEFQMCRMSPVEIAKLRCQ